ncbi:hypothetical protein SAMN04488029_1910 [Reichenbachiella faecimaris]|uniref:Uncharacterized protein n=1 Tax=Reichenbachiella faecimaris TaxID=692418 RepID=A0A1W2GCM8_REIFA|nr:hypothetical protein SAMN04488029_1910 [Reichenbachiella faecimaris]
MEKSDGERSGGTKEFNLSEESHLVALRGDLLIDLQTTRN